ncbi:Bicoid-interacting protein 3-domain-containing protein [Morchella snyderi]|nr:Bicoid-interacting protein 3-domain-containing protein [Morchella snyderi]
MAQYGNYKGYQGASRHDGLNRAPHVIDYRLQALANASPDLFNGKDILDIGCNNGAIAVHLGISFSPASVTGVDIDRELVQKAISHLSLRYSRTAPIDGESVPAESSQVERNNYFPISSVLQHGHRNYHQDLDPAKFPFNVAFRCENWATSPPLEPGFYSVILALSMVKWVHLQGFDEGLRAFFAKVHLSLCPSGYFILEPQEWESYKRAVKKNKILEGNYKKLEIRPDDFQSILEEMGFSLLQKLDTSLKRDIFIYQRN